MVDLYPGKTVAEKTIFVAFPRENARRRALPKGSRSTLAHGASADASVKELRALDAGCGGGPGRRAEP
jgi:hypothetical protein